MWYDYTVLYLNYENNNRRKHIMKNEKTYELVLTALFTAIIIIMAFTRNYHPYPCYPWSAISGTEERCILRICIWIHKLYQQHLQGGHALGFCIFTGAGFKPGGRLRNL